MTFECVLEMAIDIKIIIDIFFDVSFNLKFDKKSMSKFSINVIPPSPSSPVLTLFPKITSPHLASEDEKHTEVPFARLHGQAIASPHKLAE